MKSHAERLLTAHGWIVLCLLFACVSPAMGDEAAAIGRQVEDLQSEVQAAEESGESLAGLETRIEEMDTILRGYQPDSPGAVLEFGEWLERMGFVCRRVDDPPLAERAWDFFGRALETYAGSTLIADARERYLGLVFELAADPVKRDLDTRFALVPSRRGWLENAVRLAETPGERALAHYLMARFLSGRPSNSAAIQQIGEHLTRAVEADSQGIYRIAALFHLANWSREYGTRRFGEAGRVIFEPDFERALTLYRRVINEGGSADAELIERSRIAVDEILLPELDLFVANAFKPDAQPFFHVRHRNLEEPVIRVFPLDLLVDLPSSTGSDLLAGIDLSGRTPVFETRSSRQPERSHYRVSERVVIANGLPAGCYLVECMAGEEQARALLFISKIALVVRASPEAILTFVCDADTGQPVANARVRLLAAEPPRGGVARVASEEAITDSGGLAFIEPGAHAPDSSWFVLASSDEDEIYASVAAIGQRREDEPSAPPSAFAFADRPLVSAGQEVAWKAIVRGADSETGGAPDIRHVITDVAGGVLSEGILQLNPFGGASGVVRVPAQTPAGPVRIQIFTTGDRPVFSGPLFDIVTEVESEIALSMRLESMVSGAERDVFTSGDSIEGSVSVAYGSGLPVSDARVTVEAMVRPLQDSGSQRAWRLDGSWQVIADAAGVASFAIDVPQDLAEDLEYLVRASASDTAGNEVTVERLVPVTRQAYFVRLQSGERIFDIDESLRVQVETVDARGRPVPISGQIRLTREKWREVYVHFRRGNTITGEEYRALPERSLLGTARSDYRLRQQGFVTEEVVVREVATGADGIARIELQNPGTGYYRVTWQSSGRWDLPVRAEERIWVARAGDVTMGYRADGIELVADLARLRRGEPLPVLAITQRQNQFVVLLRDGARAEVLHAAPFAGNAHLFMVPIPNDSVDMLSLEAFCVHDNSFAVDEVRVRLPERRGGLVVDVSAAQRGFEPGARAALEVRVTDEQGMAVQAEVAVVGHQRGEAFDPVRAARRLGPQSAGVPVVETGPGETVFWRSFDWLPFYDPTRGDSLVPLEGSRILEPFGSMLAPAMTLAPGSGPGDGGAGVASVSGAALPEGLSGSSASRMAVRVPAGAPGTEPVFNRLDLRSDEDGSLRVEVPLPERAGAWVFEVLAVDAEGRVGEASLEVNTRLPVVARLIEPRYLYVGDHLVLPGVVANNTAEPVALAGDFSASGNIGVVGESRVALELPGRAEGLLRWDLDAREAGEAVLVFAATGEAGAVTAGSAFPVFTAGVAPAGVAKVWMGSHLERIEVPLRGKDPATLKGEAELLVTPGVAPLLIERLHSLLADQTPQAGSVFHARRVMATVPAIEGLRRLGFGPTDLQRVLALMNDDPETAPAADFEAYEAWVRREARALLDLQRADGAWPWMPDDPADLRMTSIALRALQTIADSGFAVPEERLEAGRAFLERMLLSGELSLESMVQALTGMSARFQAEGYARPTRLEARVFDRLMRERDDLPVSSLALLAIAAADYGFSEDAEVLLPALAASAVGSGEGSLRRVHWTAGEDGSAALEATGLVVQALLRIDPAHELAGPAMAWLLEAGGSYRDPVRWESLQRIRALVGWVRTTAELEAEAEVRVVNGDREIARFEADPGSLLRVPYRLHFESGHIDLSQPVVIERIAGQGPVYGEVVFAAPEATGPESRHGLSIERNFMHMNPTPTLLAGFRENLEPWPEQKSVPREHNLTTVLRIGVERPAEFVVVRDFCAAGVRVVGIQDRTRVALREILRVPGDDGSLVDAGYTGREISAYLLFDGRRLVLNIRDVPAGVWEFSYRARAEFGGLFRAPPPVVSLVFDNAAARGTNRILLIDHE